MKDLKLLFTTDPITYARYTGDDLTMKAEAEATKVHHKIAAIKTKHQVRQEAKAIEKDERRRR